MNTRVVLFCDHTIGYNLTQYLLSDPNVLVLDIYSNERTSNAWWKDIFELEISFGKKIKIFNRYLLEDLLRLDFDYLLLFSWKHIVPDRLLKVPKMGVVNLHYSLLPRHRGVYPVNWALIQGDNETGISFHFVDNNIDGGDIIGQRSLPISSSDTTNSLLSKLDTLAFELFKEIWEKRHSWNVIRVKQSESKSSYHSRVDFLRIGEIEPDQKFTSSDLFNLIRGKSFNGKCQLLYKGKNQNWFLEISLNHHH